METVKMNVYYAKAILYAYPHLEAVMEQIDELIEKKALSSMHDFSPCEAQCEKILFLTEQKQILINLKLCVDKILRKFSAEDLDLFDYKYFKKKPKEYFEYIDTSSRKYFRRQISIVKKFSLSLEKEGYDDIKFQKECFKIDFLKELLKRVVENEMLSRKNKPMKEKLKQRANLIQNGANERTA